MNTYKLSNISIRDYRKFLERIGYEKIRTKGSHESWGKKGHGRRPIILSSHVDPVGEDIIRENNETLGLTRKQFIELFYKRK